MKITRNIETEALGHRVFSTQIDNYDLSSKSRKRSIARLSHMAAREEPSLSITQELHNVFTPHLPPELWLQILMWAVRDEKDATIAGSHYTRRHSFLEFVPAHTHLPERLARYNSWLKWKASLTTVCSLFNVIAQEVLYEDVWITGSTDGRRLAERLGGSVAAKVSSFVEKETPRQGHKSWWTRFGSSKPKPKSPTFPVHRSSYTSTNDPHKPDPGRFIRRLRIETYSMDQCSPHDLLLILQHCPALLAFEDCRGIRRPIHPLIISASEVAPFAISPDTGGQEPDSGPVPLLTIDVLAQTILSRPLKRVTWTNYAHDGGNFDRGVRVYLQVLGPLLEKAGSDVEVLEIITSAGGMSMGSRESEDAWVVATPGGFDTGLQRMTSGGPPTLVKHLKLESESVVTRQFTSMNLHGLSSLIADLPPSTSVLLPCLESLKATLDNAIFFVLSSWSLPSLRNLSVVSPDFKYGLEGFRRFLEAHGDNLRQLELGHSAGELEEFWVTEQSSEFRRRSRIRLDVLCPNLKEFICNADAEWNWESPDWIAPHVLLPSHPGLELIGVRGLEKRFINDAAEFTRTDSEEEYPYFMLLQQFSSMLRTEAFPSLGRVRDLSWQSNKIRRTSRLRPGPKGFDRPSATFSFLRPSRLSPSHWAPRSTIVGKTVLSSHVLRFWDDVLKKCMERGVSVENHVGAVITSRDLVPICREQV